MKKAASVLLASVSLLVSSAGFAAESLDSGLSIARKVMSTAIQNPERFKDPALAEVFQKVETAMSGKVRLVRREDGRCLNQVSAWVEPADFHLFEDERTVVIYTCPRFAQHSDLYIAQTLIHETTHFLFQTDEKEATRLEILALFFGGESPRWSGYIDKFGSPKAQYDNGAQVIPGFEYIQTVGVKNKIEYAGWKWSFGMMGDVPLAAIQAAWEKQKQNFSETELTQILNFADAFGTTALMGAAREGALEQVQFLLSLPGIQPNLKNNKGLTAKQIAEFYGHSDIASLL